MAHAEGSILINRPVKVVYDFVLDGMNNPLWRSGVLDIRHRRSTPSGAGAVYIQGFKGPGGSRVDGDYEITECKPNESIRFRVVAGPARPTGSYKFEAAGEATRVTFTLHLEPKGLMRMMDGMVNQQMQVEVRALDNLKKYLEEQEIK